MSGYYELRFFAGPNQGRTCNALNRQFNDEDNVAYSKCQLVALSTGVVYVAPIGSAPQTHVPGLKEHDTAYMRILR